jgi:periplasmic protein TonB
MTTAVANPPPFGLRRFLVYSGILHGLLLIWIVLAAYTNLLGPRWQTSGGGGAVVVNLVSSGEIPMPKPPSVTESKTVDPTKSLYKEEEVKPPPEPPKSEEKIPEFKHEKPLPPSRKSRIMENKTPVPDNAVPGPSSGAPHMPTGYAANQNAGSQGPVSAQGPGGEDFASRYPWYIEAVKRRIQGNWLQNTIDPGVRAARAAHAVVQFTIERDGTVKDVHITQGSGNYSMDNSGLRAVIASNPMPALPSDYSGSYLNVVFDFNLALNQ